ncbi:pep-cterm sorting domain-containing protein [Anaeramoeba ignava]|uniref:Pep-cterm sorting domain-containing protein n=1 Tax=Anaeramoeba ignava TaxID=1746090 RepID=A0A9Q0R655_ANAIG|nr:pep-cterm sorting domain-containing protein [Anaeramoeba ignava]
MKEYQENKLILKDVSSEIVSLILNYFYSGKIEINLENAIQILIFASKYLIDELIEICTIFIMQNCQIGFVVDVLKLCESMNFNNLIEFCYQFILENFNEFIKTSFFLELEENHLNSLLSNDDISTNEFEIFQSIIKWGKHKSNINQEKELDKEEKEKLQNQISNVIDKIRFIDFKKQELEDILKGYLIPNQISQKLIQFQKIQNQNDEKEYEQFIEKENQNENSFIFKSRFRFGSTIIRESNHFRKIKQWINDDEFISKMRLGFSAKRDGFSAEKFHEKCDNKGNTLVIIKTTDNYIFGGFTREGWNYGFQRYITDPNAFIFSLRNPKNDPPQKFTLRQNCEGYALYYFGQYGPNFGSAYDICLKQDLRSGYTNFGSAYHIPEGIRYETEESMSYLGGSYDQWIVDEIECFFI